MDVHKLSVPASRLEVVEIGRRRRWSEEEKLRVVLESLAGPRLVSATARRHGISRSLLTRWRREFRPERRDEPVAGFMPAVVVPETAKAPATMPVSSPKPGAGRMEIVLGRGRSVVVDASVDPDALGRVLDVLERR
jgi:transposase